jgi:hypothetical protein
MALIFPKAGIASVKPTGGKHICCGKRLEIAEITFAKDARISVAEVFAQAASAASSIQAARTGANATTDPCEGCMYQGKLYTHQAIECMAHVKMQCIGGDGGPYFWSDIGTC